MKPTAVPSPVASFDLEATLCPICDEACTCPKTTTIIVKSPSKKSTVSEPVTSKKPATKKNNKKEKPKYIKKYEISEDSESEEFYEEEESEAEDSGAIVEDPALSFIRMIYSDEESLDEEEAYALYQATQLFSSSSDEAEYFEDYSEQSDDEDDDIETDSSDDDFEYTVVEYVQPSLKKQILSKKSTEFVAYESGDESETEESQNPSNLLLNTENPGDSSGSDDKETTSEDDDSNWLTYSVFDVDRDLALNHVTGSSCTSLSSHGSGTPDTLLFSTSSTDKIPNIAPQVLAAISAAAKHMANQRSDNNSTSSSKYFSYITLRDPLRGGGAGSGGNEEVNEEEFLFFEEAAAEIAMNSSDSEDCSSITSEVDIDVDGDDLEEISVEDSEEFESFSEDCSSNESVTEIILPVKKSINNKTAPTISTSTTATTTTTTEYFNRWNRVPIGAFRRSRRPSIPNYHQIHPSTALKTFSTDPANFTLTSATSTAGEDSFDEGCATTVPPERAYSVITWDELDLDIAPSTGNNANLTASSGAYCPLPKRSRSVMASSNSLANNFEWLNNNWNWEI